MADELDPWDWTVEQVIDVFCHDRTLWQNGRPNSTLPDPAIFEKTLSESEINGSTLLVDVDMSTLKDDFNIKSLGQKSSILWAIGQLRKRSRKYAVNHPPPMPASVSYGNTPHTPYLGFDPRPTIYSPPLSTQAIAEHNKGTGAGASPLFSRSLAPDQSLTIPDLHTSMQEDTAGLAAETPGKRRIGETVVEDGSGRKKRRLDLGGAALVTPDVRTGDQVPEMGENFRSSAMDSFVTSRTSTDTVTTLNIDRLQLCGSTTLSYLGKNKLSFEDMFFDPANKEGRPLNEEIAMTPLNTEGLPTDDIFTFTAGDNKSVYGRQAVAHKMMVGFLNRNEDLEIVSSEDTIAFYPYATQESESRSLICVKETNGKVIAIRAKPSVLNTLTSDLENLDSDAAVSSNNEWNFLKHWKERADGSPLPLYGESDSERESVLDALEKEIEADQEEDQQATATVLGAEAVAVIIDETIATQVSRWKEKKLPVLQDKRALSTWRKAANSKDRRILATLAQAEVGKCEQNIDKIRARINEEQRWKETALRTQCESFEETVRRREEEKWKRAVWQRPTAPPGPTGKLRTRKKRHTNMYSNTEHVLDSDEEIVVDEDDAEFLDLDAIDLTEVPSTEHQIEDKEEDEALPEGAAQSKRDPGKEMDQDPIDEVDSDSVEEMNTKTVDEMDVDEPHHKPGSVHTASESDSVIGRQPDSDEMPDADETDGESDDSVIKEEPTVHPFSTSKGKAQIDSEVIIISDSEDEVDPAAAPRPSQIATQSPRYSSNPEKDSDQEVADWDFGDLEYNEDCCRIIIKLVRTMPPDEYKRLREYVLEDNGDDYRERVYTVADGVWGVLRKFTKVGEHFEMAQFAYDRAVELLHLWVCWLEKEAHHFRIGHDALQETFELASLDEQALRSAAKQFEEDQGIDLLNCLGVIERVFKRHANSLGEEEEVEEEEDSIHEVNPEEGSQLTPRKRRKNAVAESQFAISKRTRNKQTAKAWEDRSKLFLSQHQALSSDLALAVADEGIIVNIGKEKEDEAILINPKVAKLLKAHQVEGIRFMWREVIGTADDSDEPQGCLIAHTMGLGKTFSSIAFLTTLAQAVRSSRDSIVHQIPKKLQLVRTLILCPAGLLTNWCEEFAQWNKDRVGIGKPIVIDAQTKPSDRLALLNEWYKTGHGGVLLMGYSFFRKWALNPESKHGKRPFTPEQHAQIKKQLLNGPTIVIADEAHNMKNNDAGVTQAARLLKTKSRIALTGSPLSNNLKEYYSMVDFIAPGYLGEMVQFKANYVEPIEEGLTADSTPYERKKARVKLAALIEILEPKIHRKDISALADDLPPRVQFVLKIPLTSTQTEIYRAFVKKANPGIGEDASNTRLWGFMAYMQLLCSHPTLFCGAAKTARAKWDKEMAKLAASRVKRAKSPIKRVQQLQDEGGGKSPSTEGDETDHSDEIKDQGDADDGSAPLDSVTLRTAEEVILELDDTFKNVAGQAHDSAFSNKVNLLLQIVQTSLAADDKLLIFTHRVPVLDFLGQVLKKAGIKCARLDGRTDMKSRQSMTKRFNEGLSENVFLISTRAGGTGFNLFGANRIVLFDFSFNPTWEEQAIGRGYRLGQKKPVYVYRFISAGTFEEALFNQTVFKLQLAGEVVEKKKTKSKASRLRQYIKMPTATTREDFDELLGNDKVLDAIIENMEDGKELIHGIKLDTTYKEEDKEPFDEEDRKELAELVEQNKLMNADPEAYRAQQLARSYLPPATARAVSYTGVPAAMGLGRMPASTAQRAPMLPPARTVSAPFNIPAAANFPPLSREPHGLPYPAGPPAFSMGSASGTAVRSTGLPNQLGGGSSPAGRPRQEGH